MLAMQHERLKPQGKANFKYPSVIAPQLECFVEVHKYAYLYVHVSCVSISCVHVIKQRAFARKSCKHISVCSSVCSSQVS